MAKIYGMDGKSGQTPPQQNQQIQVNPKDSSPLVCENCGYDVFLPANKFRKVSKILTGAPQDILLPVEVFVCSGCGEINQELLPEQLKNLDD